MAKQDLQQNFVSLLLLASAANVAHGDLDRVVIERFGDVGDETTMVHAVYDGREYSKVFSGPAYCPQSPCQLTLSVCKMLQKLQDDLGISVFELFELSPDAVQCVNISAEGKVKFSPF